ncbi:uncharacterized protein LOC142225960 [Haematobia irritans]|uniref:uncharacterized protein LOC142225960 n=1 Tax=Haematobia irritans TaxID=7368 RepID=UPI003F4F99AF
MSQKLKRKVWTKSETLLFLSCYRARKEDFKNPRRKISAYSCMLDDMIFQGFKDSSITPESLENKMKSLLRAYKSAKDNAGRTGAGATCVPYMDELEELFGRQPTISNSHSLDVGIEQRCTPSKLSVESYENMSIEILSEDEYEYS